MKFHHNPSNLASVGLAIAASIFTMTFSPNVTASAIAQEAAPTVTTPSSTKAINLAKHLRKKGVKLYTAFWCPYCHRQKERFGKEASKQLEVIECDERGVNPQRQLCRDKKITGYPTWEIDGKLYPGNRSLENLAEISKYRGE